MNLTELVTKRKTIEVKVRAQHEQALSKLISELPFLSEDARVAKQKELDELTTYCAEETKRECRVINQRIRLVSELNQQFRLDFITVLWDQIRFQLKCLVDEEKRKPWWQKLFQTNQFAQTLRLYEGLFDADHLDFTKLKTHLTGCVSAVSVENDSVLSGQINYFLQLNLGSSRVTDNTDPLEVVNKALNNPDSPSVTALNASLRKLCQVAETKQTALQEKFDQQDKLETSEKLFQFDAIIPGHVETAWDEQQDATRAKCERLVLEARYPWVSENILQAPELPLSVMHTPQQRVMGVATTRGAWSQTPSMSLKEQVESIIAQIYNFQETPIQRNNLLNHVKKMVGGWSWNPFKPSEYKTIQRLLSASEHSVLNDAATIDAMRRIQRLSHLDHFKASNNYSDQLRMAFGNARQEISISPALIATEEMNVFRASLDKREEALAKHVHFQSQAESLPVEQRGVNQQNLLDKSASDLQALAYFISKEHFVKNSDPAIAELPSSMPVIWAVNEGLRINPELSAYKNLLTEIQGLEKYKAFYFVVLLISIELMRTKGAGADYQRLQALLTHVFERKSFEATISLKEVGMDWLLNYLPKDIFSRQNVASPTLGAAKGALLGEEGLFPLRASPSESLAVSVDHIGKSNDTLSRTISFTQASFRSQSEPKNERNKRGVYDSFSGKLKTKEGFLSSALEMAKKIMSKPLDHNAIQGIAKKTFEAYPKIADKRIILLDVLLEWYQTQRPNNPNDSKHNQATFLGACKRTQKILHDNGWFYGEPSTSSLSLNHLEQLKTDGFVRSGSGKNLISAIYEIFPDRQIAGSITDSLIAASEKSGTYDKAIVAPENSDYINRVRAWAGKIKSMRNSNIESILHVNLERYPTANKNILAIYCLWQWFKSTDRGRKIFEPRQLQQEQDKVFHAEYKKMLVRLECAMKKSETVPEEEILGFMPQKLACEPYSKFNVECSLDFLFNRTRKILAPKNYKENPDEIIANVGSPRFRADSQISSAESTSGGESVSSHGVQSSVGSYIQDGSHSDESDSDSIASSKNEPFSAKIHATLFPGPSVVEANAVIEVSDVKADQLEEGGIKLPFLSMWGSASNLFKGSSYGQVPQIDMDADKSSAKNEPISLGEQCIALALDRIKTIFPLKEKDEAALKQKVSESLHNLTAEITEENIINVAFYCILDVYTKVCRSGQDGQVQVQALKINVKSYIENSSSKEVSLKLTVPRGRDNDSPLARLHKIIVDDLYIRENSLPAKHVTSANQSRLGRKF